MQINSVIALYSNGQIQAALDAVEALIKDYPNEAMLHNICGACYAGLGQLDTAVKRYEKSITIKPEYADAHNNLAVTLQELGQLDEAVKSYEQALTIKPDYAEAFNNLGIVLKELGQLDTAVKSYEKILTIKPDFAEAHYNLAVTLQELGQLDEAVKSYEQAIAIKPDYAEAHNNLGGILREFGKIGESVKSYEKVLTIKPDFAEAYNNLGVTLKELGRLEEVEVSYRQAIALKPDYADAHINLGIILYSNGDLDSALESMEKANSINPKSKSIRLLLIVLQARKTRETTEVSVGNISNLGCDIRLTSNPLILNRAVESELIANLYEMKSLELDKIRDPSYGNARGSGYNLFEDDRSIIKTVAEDLVSMIMEAVKADVFVEESFYTILGAGGGLNRHNHVSVLDRDSSLNLANQKYSLVYYLSIGDQDCSEPGILKLYDPSENILPCEGMIAIFPADRYHSVVYNGKKDRVIIGINFYSL